MTSKKKMTRLVIIGLCVILFLLNAVFLVVAGVYLADSDKIRPYEPVSGKDFTSIGIQQKHVSLVDSMPSIPQDFQLIDWQEKAEGYYNVAFNPDLQDEQDFLPLFRVFDVNGTRIGVIPAFVGLKEESGRKPNDYLTGNSEAVTFVNSVLSGSLIGIDMSDVYGEDYVSMCLQFINSEGVLTNWLGGASMTTSMWYMQYSTIQLFALADLYPGKTDLIRAVRVIADKYYDALVVLGGGSEDGLNMDIQSFDFKNMEPVTQMPNSGRWTEQDSASSIGLLMYWAYRRWGDDKFLRASIWCADYMDTLEMNPQYEIAYVYCPYLMAMLNAEAGTNYDITKQFEKILSTGSDVRDGWGYTNAEINTGSNPALYAVCQSGNPYYWYMNTVEGAAAFIPLVLYDQSFADVVGKYVLNAVNSSRYFFSDGPLADQRNADATVWQSEYAKYIPFEALHWTTNNGTVHIKNGNVPENAMLTLSGDPVEENWDFQTEHSMYSGASTGKFGGTVFPTDVEGILQIDLSKLDFMRNSPAYKTYLYYNPYEEDKEITIDLGYKFYDLYDSVSDTFLARGATGSVKVVVPASSSITVVLADRDCIRRQAGNNIYLNNCLVAHR